MKRLFIITFFLLFACGAALAEGDKKPFVQFAKGNFWKYDVIQDEGKESGKMEVAEIGKEGGLKLRLTNMGMGSPEAMTWKVGKDYLSWEFMPGMDWKVLKFGAKKGDNWSSSFGKMGMDPEDEMVLKSGVVAVEDVQTTAGNFKGCLKIENIPTGQPGPQTSIYMWWAKGVGLVKFEVIERGKTETSWILTSYKAGPDISDEKLKELVEKADVVAIVTIPKEGVGSKKVQVKLSGLFKGEPKEEEGDIIIALPEQDKEDGAFEEGDFVAFLKKEGEALILLRAPVHAGKDLLDRLTKLVTPPDQTLEKLEELCRKSEIIIGVEVVVLEDRGSFKYYVAKIISTAKGASGRKYLDVLCLPGVKLEKGGKYILFLVNAEESGRTLTRLVDAVKGVLDYDEALLGKLGEISKGSK